MDHGDRDRNVADVGLYERLSSRSTPLGCSNSTAASCSAPRSRRSCTHRLWSGSICGAWPVGRRDIPPIGERCRKALQAKRNVVLGRRKRRPFLLARAYARDFVVRLSELRRVTFALTVRKLWPAETSALIFARALLARYFRSRAARHATSRKDYQAASRPLPLIVPMRKPGPQR
jgi:hypothetical protein